MTLSSQYHWTFGRGCHLEFVAGGEPIVKPQLSMFTGEGCACISDQDGGLLFYTNGVHLWNSVHQQITLQSPLGGNQSAAQTAIIVPPASAGAGEIYHLFTIPARTSPGTPVQYTPVKVTGSNVTIQAQTTSLPGLIDTTEHLVAVSHQDAGKFWVVAFGRAEDKFAIYLVDSDSSPTLVGTPSYADEFGNQIDIQYGFCAKFSPAGNLLAVTNGTGSGINDSIEIFNFNRSSGQLTPHSRISNVPSAYGVEFSPDENFLYYTCQAGVDRHSIWKHSVGPSLQHSNSLNVHTQSGSGSLGGMQYGPNGKIYIAKPTSGLISIDDPNNAANLSIAEPALDRNGDPIVFPEGHDPWLSVPNFTKITEAFDAPLCDFKLIDQSCDKNGNTQIILEMANNSSNSGIDLVLEITGMPENMYAVTTTHNGITHTAQIVIDGIFSGPIAIKGNLTGFAGNQGANLCCNREIEIEVEACVDDCLKIEGRWVVFWWFRWYLFTVTNTSTNANFHPGSVEVTNLPSGVSSVPNPIILTNGIGTGRITISNNIASNTVLGLIFHAESMDMCCNKWVNITVPRKRWFPWWRPSFKK